jgi:hypothetical protein
MTSIRQIEANRCNALRSTGPNTEDGKRRSRRNAVRHGLCAETVVEIIEDIDDYRGFEAAVIADHDACTAVERELVLRLASLLWRLRRATAIETDLRRIQAEILRERSLGGSQANPHGSLTEIENTVLWQPDHDPYIKTTPSTPQPISSARQLTLCFKRFANLDQAMFERLGRYESSLMRQVMKTIFLLRTARSARACSRRATRP